MKKTLRQVRLELDNISNDISKKEYEIKRNALIVTHKAPGMESEVVTMDYEFDEEFISLERLYEKRIAYETAIQETNATTKVDGKSLVEIIREINVLNMKLSTITALTDKTPYNRRVDVGNNGSFYYEQGELRYDLDSFKESKESIRKHINELECILDKMNNETLVEV